MAADLVMRDGNLIVITGDHEVVLGGQGGLSSQNIKEMLKLLYGEKRRELHIRSNSGLRPADVEQLLTALHQLDVSLDLKLVFLDEDGPAG